MQLPFNGQPAQPVWTGYGGSRGLPILCINQDTANTVYIGYQANIAVGGGNTIPLAPQSSIPLDGSRTIYAIAAAGTQPLLVIPGASNFFQRLTSITIPTGATSGARIVINGLTGQITAFNANNRVAYILTPTAILMYR